MSHWYFQKDGKEVGPISANHLVDLAGQGSMQLTTLVRRDDMTEPIPAEKVKELKAAILGSASSGQQKPEADQQIESEDQISPDTTGASPTDKTPSIDPDEHSVLTITENLANRVTSLAGVEKLEGFSLGNLFSEVFKKHNAEEVEEYFTVGAPSTTPDILNVDTSWPRPWVFFRTFVAAFLVYWGFLQMWLYYENANVLPGLMVTGSFVVPAATLIFFIEMNARRNVSLYQVVRLVFAGGVISLALSLMIFRISDFLPAAWLGASVAGPIEETGKMLALLIVIYKCKYRYTLNGLLFGAAVGTGFAAFESAGYAFRAFFIDIIVNDNDKGGMTSMIEMRGIEPPPI